MTVLPDHAIQARIQAGLIDPPNFDAINPASVDVHLGPSILIESLQHHGFVTYPFGKHTEADPFTLRPGQFILAATAETVAMPDDLAAQVQLKSSVARLGLEHLMAGWIDPGFTGTVTLELHNSRQLQPIPIWPGMPIAQLVLLQMQSIPDHSYAITGRYNGQRLPTPSMGVVITPQE
jgi:dCTP deaminase